MNTAIINAHIGKASIRNFMEKSTTFWQFFFGKKAKMLWLWDFFTHEFPYYT